VCPVIGDEEALPLTHRHVATHGWLPHGSNWGDLCFRPDPIQAVWAAHVHKVWAAALRWLSPEMWCNSEELASQSQGLLDALAKGGVDPSSDVCSQRELAAAAAFLPCVPGGGPQSSSQYSWNYTEPPWQAAALWMALQENWQQQQGVLTGPARPDWAQDLPAE